MALIGLLLSRIAPDLNFFVFGRTPVMALPWVISLLPIWPRRPSLIAGLMLALCYSAQWSFSLVALKLPSLVIALGAFSALLAGLISAKLGNRLHPKFWFYPMLLLSGAFSMTLLYKYGKYDPNWVTIPVWIWQMTIGSILIVGANQASVTREFNMGVLQT
ncbi:MAG: hypothetical protein IPJ85_16605 [Flavobacteriales bacterium]|nr:hypothetical protein [Flavobacteriales bacterium]